ncbi:hypothetical protein BGAL_0055g00120 [Botrytis galanthina]|uniref:Uncharacterized protein n=1 Tax=Botrytis galanthina TaxID=278940 RepID=A0A4S8R5R7_9HELO|nr:hypothetical protein BGAL_0055g00120 [Botrytis galanthina]
MATSSTIHSLFGLNTSEITGSHKIGFELGSAENRIRTISVYSSLFKFMKRTYLWEFISNTFSSSSESEVLPGYFTLYQQFLWPFSEEGKTVVFIDKVQRREDFDAERYFEDQ